MRKYCKMWVCLYHKRWYVLMVMFQFVYKVWKWSNPYDILQNGWKNIEFVIPQTSIISSLEFLPERLTNSSFIYNITHWWN
jgi:hypothetical protein